MGFTSYIQHRVPNKWHRLLLGVLLGALTVALVVALTPLSWGAEPPYDPEVDDNSLALPLLTALPPQYQLAVGEEDQPVPKACPRDDPCFGDRVHRIRSAQDFVDKYKNDRLGRVGRATYSATFKDIILGKAHRKWRKIHAKELALQGGDDQMKCGICLNWQPEVQWDRFRSTDTCASIGYPTNMAVACTPDNPYFICHNDPGAGNPQCSFAHASEEYMRNYSRVVFCGATFVPAIFSDGWLWFGYGASTCFGGFFVD